MSWMSKKWPSWRRSAASIPPESWVVPIIYDAPPEPVAVARLPFVYVPECEEQAKHDGRTMCLRCEEWIAILATSKDNQHVRECEDEEEAARFRSRSFVAPNQSGLGAVNGPVMSTWKAPRR